RLWRRRHHVSRPAPRRRQVPGARAEPPRCHGAGRARNGRRHHDSARRRPGARRMNPQLRRSALIAPSIVAIVALLVPPPRLMASISTLARGAFGGVRWDAHSADAYFQFLFERDLMDRLVVNTDYLRIFLRSMTLAAATTVVTLLVGFPTALWMAFQPAQRRT